MFGETTCELPGLTRNYFHPSTPVNQTLPARWTRDNIFLANKKGARRTFKCRLAPHEIGEIDRALEESDGVDHAHATPDFRREVFDERQVIAVELVVQVERVD